MKYFSSLFLVLFLVGCGSSGGGSDSDSGSCSISGSTPKSGDTQMELSKAYILSPGDIIIKTSEPSSVQITHCQDQSKSSVTLKEGSAIIRKP